MPSRARRHPTTPREPPSPKLTYFEDRGTVLDAPLDVVWDFMQNDEKFHPRAHGSTLRNFKARRLSEVSIRLRCEVRDGVGDGWRRMVARMTTIRPAMRVVEELEGELGGSKMVFLYTPRGKRTAVDIFCYMRSSTLSPTEIRRRTLASFASAHREDLPFLRRYARQHPSKTGSRS